MRRGPARMPARRVIEGIGAADGGDRRGQIGAVRRRSGGGGRSNRSRQ